jgi:CDP-4-dehydro-6-deoxyglucose reductase, E1
LHCSFITRHRSHASEKEEKREEKRREEKRREEKRREEKRREEKRREEKRREEKRREEKRGINRPKQVKDEEKDSGTVIAKTVYVSVS